MARAMDHDDVLVLLRQACEREGSQKRWAAAWDLSPQYVSDVLSGRREPGKTILDSLGLERVVTYRKRR